MALTLSLLGMTRGAETELTLGVFHTSSIPAGGAPRLHRLWLGPESPADIKVVLMPLDGDSDCTVSFDMNNTADASSSWTMSGSGIEELLLRHAVRPSRCAVSGCFLYLRVRTYYEEYVTYNLAVLEAREPFTTGECSPGCPAELLANPSCDVQCNTSACAFDRGACIPQLAAVCSPGCQDDWLDDGYCDDACYTSECAWDRHDCEYDLEGCADR